MTDDQMNPKICPSALDENGNNAFADDESGGRHKWDGLTIPISCAECGTEYDEELHGEKHICSCGNEHYLTPTYD
jgi:hypothetical protein